MGVLRMPITSLPPLVCPPGARNHFLQRGPDGNCSFYEGVFVKPRRDFFFRAAGWQVSRGRRTPRPRAGDTIHQPPSGATSISSAFQHFFPTRPPCPHPRWGQGGRVGKKCCPSHRRPYPVTEPPGQPPPGGFLRRRGCCDDLLSVPTDAQSDTTHCLRPQAFRGSLARTHPSGTRFPLGNTRNCCGGPHQVTAPAHTGSSQDTYCLRILMVAIVSHHQPLPAGWRTPARLSLLPPVERRGACRHHVHLEVTPQGHQQLPR